MSCRVLEQSLPGFGGD